MCARLCDSFGDHVGVCPAGGDKTRRHNAVRDILFLAARGVALSVEREPKHLLLCDGQKQYIYFCGITSRVFMPQLSTSPSLTRCNLLPLIVQLRLLATLLEWRMKKRC